MPEFFSNSATLEVIIEYKTHLLISKVQNKVVLDKTKQAHCSKIFLIRTFIQLLR